MRIAVVADVHGNLEALNVVLDDLKKSSPDTVISLGDVVGYGANPQECCELLMEIVNVNIMGNHDAAVMGVLDTEYFNDEARYAVQWTKDQLSSASISWLGSSPHTFSDNNMLFSHGSPVNPRDFDYVVSTGDIEAVFYTFKDIHSLFFVGHSHRRFSASKSLSGNDYYPVGDISDVIKINKKRQYLFSVGSIGQPRDMDSTTSYGMLDTDKRIYSVKRLNYDIRTASEKIIKAGLPRWLAYRLMIGV